MNDQSIESTCPDCGERFEVDLRIGGRRALEQHKRRCAGKPNVVQHFAQQAYEHALRQDQERFASGDWRKHLSKRCSCSGKAGPASRGELCASCPKHTAETYEAMMAATQERMRAPSVKQRRQAENARQPKRGGFVYPVGTIFAGHAAMTPDGRFWSDGAEARPEYLTPEERRGLQAGIDARERLQQPKSVPAQPKTAPTSWDVGEIVLTQQDDLDLFGGVA